MKAKLMGLAIACVLISTNILAEEGFGLGIIVGEPTGISAKYWMSDKTAVDAAAAWSFSENDSFQFHADYLIHNFNLINLEEMKGKLPVYFGIGGRLKLKESDGDKGRNSDDSLLGIRVPVGIAYLVEDAPLDIFAEIIPVLDIAPDTEFDLNAAIGVRFYFR